MISVSRESSSLDHPKGPTFGLGWYGDVIIVFCGTLLLTMLGGAWNSGGGGKFGGIILMPTGPGGGDALAPLSSE